MKRWLQKRFRRVWKDKMKPLSTGALPAGYHDRWSNFTKQNNGLCAWIRSGENIVILKLAGGSKLDIYCWLFFYIFGTFNSFVIVNLVSRQMFQMWNNWGYSKLICWLLTYSVHTSPFIIQIECMSLYDVPQSVCTMCVLKRIKSQFLVMETVPNGDDTAMSVKIKSANWLPEKELPTLQ